MRTLKWLFGEDTHLSDFDAEMVDTAFQDLQDNGGPSGHAVTPSSAGYLKAPPHAVIRYAIKDGYLLANPLDGTEHIPVRAPEKDDVPSAADVKALLDALDCRDGRQMCVYLCATLGLRPQAPREENYSPFETPATDLPNRAALVASARRISHRCGASACRPCSWK